MFCLFLFSSSLAVQIVKISDVLLLLWFSRFNFLIETGLVASSSSTIFCFDESCKFKSSLELILSIKTSFIYSLFSLLGNALLLLMSFASKFSTNFCSLLFKLFENSAVSTDFASFHLAVVDLYRAFLDNFPFKKYRLDVPLLVADLRHVNFRN